MIDISKARAEMTILNKVKTKIPTIVQKSYFGKGQFYIWVTVCM